MGTQDTKGMLPPVLYVLKTGYPAQGRPIPQSRSGALVRKNVRFVFQEQWATFKICKNHLFNLKMTLQKH